jgi:DNA-3-methyladenine glycosylase I
MRSERVAVAGTVPRCPWAEGSELERAYHDVEWGVPEHDDRALFELLTLEGAQAGLSWRTVLRKRDHYRAAFHGFDIGRTARMGDAELETLLELSGLIRHRLKIFSVRDNARAALRVIEQVGSLHSYVWSFVDGAPVVNAWTERSQVPARTALSDRLAKDLRQRGFRFVGSTICYAFMQASGMVNDHLVGCFRHAGCGGRPRPMYRRSESNGVWGRMVPAGPRGGHSAGIPPASA